MAESATATFTSVPSGPDFQYTITLHNTGTTQIGTFWFAWDDVPDQDFMSSQPSKIASPTGWNSIITTHPGTGFGIEWIAGSGFALQPGGTLSTFTFTSADTPAMMAGKSAIDPNFDTTSSFVYQTFAFSDPGFILTVAPACFRTGTRIRTTRGDVAVEELRPGDMLQTIGGTARPLRWLGRRRIDCTRHPAPHEVWPVRVMRDAIAPGQPARDLYLSPDHALFLDQRLVPVKCLINDTTIIQQAVDEVVYFHVELEQHNVLFAEGLPAESYLDTGDRGTFENGTGPIRLHPDFAVRVWESAGYAPLLVGGAGLGVIRQRLKGRAELLLRRTATVA